MIEQNESATIHTSGYKTEIKPYSKRYSLLLHATPGIGISQRLQPLVNDDAERPKFGFETGKAVQVVGPDKTVVWEKKVPDNKLFGDLRLGLYTKLANRKVRKRNKSVQT